MSRHALALTALLLSSVPAYASITFCFTGQVTGDAINGCGGLVNCGSVSGSYDFDPATPDLNPADPQTGLYAATNFTFSIDGVLFFSSSSGLINVGNDYSGPVDQYGLIATGTASNASTAEFDVFLADLNGTTFSSDVLPVDPKILGPMLPGMFQLNAVDDSFQLQGTIDRIATPEPSSVASLSLGICALLLLHFNFKRKTQNADF